MSILVRRSFVTFGGSCAPDIDEFMCYFNTPVKERSHAHSGQHANMSSSLSRDGAELTTGICVTNEI